MVRCCALLAACALGGCQSSPGVRVNVDTTDHRAIAGVEKLTATVSVGTLFDTVDVKDRSGRFMIPPPAQLFELSFATTFRGLDATLLVQALASDGTALAGEQLAFNTGQSQTVEIRLGPRVISDMGVTCTPDAGATDVGCGGPYCPPCAVDQKCVVASDCSTNSCVQGSCARTELAWVAVSPLPMQRSNLTAVQTSDGKLWAIGGYHQNASPTPFRADVDSYDPFADRWTPEASLHYGRSGASAAPLANGGIAVAGGYIDGSGFASGSVEYYNAVAKTWTVGGSGLNQSRSAAAMVALGGGLMIVGGERANFPPVASIATVENQASANSTWALGTAMSRGLELHAAVVVGPRVFVIGGDSTTDANAWEPFVSVWSGASWSDDAAKLSPGRNGHAAVLAADGRIYVVGGNVSPGVVVGTVETYDQVLDRWTPMKAQLRARDRLAAALGPDGRIYAVGGSNNALEVDYVDAYGPMIAFAPATPSAGAMVTVSGTNFAPNAPVTLTLVDAGGTTLATGVADGAGNLAAVTFTAPASGTHLVRAIDDFSLYPVTRPLVVN